MALLVHNVKISYNKRVRCTTRERERERDFITTIERKNAQLQHKMGSTAQEQNGLVTCVCISLKSDKLWLNYVY